MQPIHRRPRARTLATLVAATALSAPLAAHAQQTPPPQTPPPAGAGAQPASPTATPESAVSLVEAQRRLTAGLALFRDHRYREAIHEFELANSAAPSADIWYNIARAHELLGEFDAAADSYQHYLRDKVDPPDRAAVEATIASLRHQAEIQRSAQAAALDARMGFDVVPSGASVYLNGALIGTAPIRAQRTVTPGSQDVRVTAPGMQEWHGTVRVSPSRIPTIAYVRMEPETRYRTVSGGHLASYILGGLGIVGLGTGIALGIDAATMAPCGGDANTGMLAMDCSRAQTATFADVAFGAGAAFLLSAAIVYFVEAASSHTERVHAPAAR